MCACMYVRERKKKRQRDRERVCVCSMRLCVAVCGTVLQCVVQRVALCCIYTRATPCAEKRRRGITDRLQQTATHTHRLQQTATHTGGDIYIPEPHPVPRSDGAESQTQQHQLPAAHHPPHTRTAPARWLLNRWTACPNR